MKVGLHQGTVKLTVKQREVMALMADGRERSTSEIFDALGGGRSRAGLTTALRECQRKGLLTSKQVGSGYYDHRLWQAVARG